VLDIQQRLLRLCIEIAFTTISPCGLIAAWPERWITLPTLKPCEMQ
jgi:hypothetical protein